MKRTWFLAYLVAALLSSSAFAKTPNRKEIGTLVIGTIFPKSGPQTPYGQEALAGLQLAFAELKAKDPELAKHITIIEADDGSTPNGARLAAESLIRQRASLLIGSVTASSSLAIAGIADKAKKPLVVPAAASLVLASSSPYVFRSCSVDKWQGHLLAKFAAKDLGKKQAAILVDPTDTYSNDIADLFQAAFTAEGGQVALREAYKAEAGAGFAEHLKKIAASPAEVILFPTASYVEAAEVMAEMKRMKLALPLLGADRWHTPQLAHRAGSAFAGHYYPVAFSSEDNNPQIAPFVEAFKKEMHRYPSALAAMTYDAFVVAVDAFRRASGTGAEELARALARTDDLPGLLGPISMNADHNAEKAGMIMTTTLQGSRVYGLVHPQPSGKAKG